jgi:hydrogenase nickel incorporation protein HypB
MECLETRGQVGVIEGISPEGQDRTVKYPAIFATSEVVVLNKVDLIERVDFDRDFFYRSLHALNRR